MVGSEKNYKGKNEMNENFWEAKRMETIPFSSIRKVFEEVKKLERKGETIIHLEIGRPDFDTPKHIKEAAKKALDEGFVHYTSNYGILELREAIAKKLEQDNNIKVDPEKEIIVTLGTNEAILMSMLGVLNPGDEVLIPEPAWFHYRYCAKLAEAKPISIPLRPENNFQLDPQDVHSKITSRTKMLIINSPHNPTGCVQSKETLEGIAEIAQKYNLLILSDEIYEKIIYDGIRHYSIASFPGMEDRTLTINGFSKLYSMTGWRVGYVAASEKLIDCLIRVHQYTTVCACSFAQKGALSALEGPQECVNEMVKEFDRRRKLIISYLDKVEGVFYVKPQGAFYFFPSIEHFKLNSEEFVKYVLKEGKVALVPGSSFGEGGEGYVRIAYSNSYENIEEGLRRLKEILKNIKND